MTFWWIALGASVGAPARYVTDRVIQNWHGGDFPFGTLAVNLVACFVLGIMTGLGTSASAAMLAFVGTGFCGSLSTYSSFSFETMRLAEKDSRRTALTYVAVSVVAGCALAALGWWIA